MSVVVTFIVLAVVIYLMVTNWVITVPVVLALTLAVVPLRRHNLRIGREKRVREEVIAREKRVREEAIVENKRRAALQDSIAPLAHCPVCGAPGPLFAGSRCSYCRQIYTGTSD